MAKEVLVLDPTRAQRRPPYEACSPITPASQPLAATQPGQANLGEDESSAASDFQKGAASVALEQ